jgi:hypothetical protein
MNQRLSKRYTIKRIIDPPIAIRRLWKLKPVMVPKPRWEARNPPRNAPAIPRHTVIMIPPGSLPGIMNFAIIPTISPMIIHDSIPILLSSFQFLFAFARIISPDSAGLGSMERLGTAALSDSALV